MYEVALILRLMHARQIACGGIDGKGTQPAPSRRVLQVLQKPHIHKSYMYIYIYILYMYTHMKTPAPHTSYVGDLESSGLGQRPAHMRALQQRNKRE